MERGLGWPSSMMLLTIKKSQARTSALGLRREEGVESKLGRVGADTREYGLRRLSD